VALLAGEKGFSDVSPLVSAGPLLCSPTVPLVPYIQGSVGTPIPTGLGQVIRPDGSVVSANRAEIWLEKGSVTTAFPTE
jgi:hypothetical protein